MRDLVSPFVNQPALESALCASRCAALETSVCGVSRVKRALQEMAAEETRPPFCSGWKKATWSPDHGTTWLIVLRKKRA